MFARDTMVNHLLRIMGSAAHVAGGSERNVKQKLSELANPSMNSQTKVADARFALGADDGAYLRSNVMPLQTADPDCDKTLLATPQPEMLRAGQLGVLDAVEEHLKKQRAVASETLVACHRLCGWLLSIEEVATFVNTYLDSVEEANALTTAMKQAHALAKTFLSNAVDLTQAAQDLTKSEAAACELLKILLLLFDLPMTTVEAQWEETLGDNGTGTGQLQAGLDTLSMSAQLVKSTYLADKLPQDSWKLKLKRVKAVGLSGMVGPIDFGATELPHGWEEPPAGVDSLTGRTERMQALLRKMVEMQAYSAVGKTPEAMRAEAAAARSEAAEKKGDIEKLERLKGTRQLTSVENRDLRRLLAEEKMLLAKSDVAEFEALFRQALKDQDEILRNNGGRPPVAGENGFEKYNDLKQQLGRVPEVNRNPTIVEFEGLPDEPGPTTTNVLSARERYAQAEQEFETVKTTLENERLAELAEQKQRDLEAEDKAAASRAARDAQEARKKAREDKRQLEEQQAEQKARDAAGKSAEAVERGAAAGE